MRRFRLVIAGLAAVAMAAGISACTPEQVTQVEELPVAIVAGIAEWLEFDLFLHVYGDPGPPATSPTTVPTTSPPTTTPAQ